MPLSTTETSQAASAEKQAKKERAVLSSAPPPWHTVALLVLFVSIFLNYLPTLEELDQVATVKTFTTVMFPEYTSLRLLAWSRLGMAAIIFATSMHAIIWGAWWQETAYFPESKLKKVQNRISGIKTMFPFTSVAWNLLGLAFALSGYIAWHESTASPNSSLSPWILRMALILWETAAPLTLLVAAVIRYAIWPRIVRVKGSTVNLKMWRNILMHNLNVLFATMEIALLGGLPVQAKHMSLAPLVGCAYVVASWNLTHIWNAPEHGPQFLYFFFDTTVPATATKALLALLVVLMAFFYLFVFAETILDWAGGGVLVHVGFVVVICGTVMRFRD